MDRRKFLQRSSALGALTLAGCMADANDNGGGGGNDDTPTSTPPEDTPGTNPTDVAVVSSSVETVGTDCASGDGATATVSMDEATTTVSFSGRIVTSTPCYEATLERAEYDSEADRLAIEVGDESTDGVCMECTGQVDFEGTVTFEGGLPGEAYVSHDDTILTDGEGGSTQPAPEKPTLQGSAFSVTDIHSDTEATADASFDPEEETITVTGTIVGDDGCTTAKLGSASYDAESDQLTVDVATTKRDDDDQSYCTQQQIGIDYRATVSFGDGIPQRVAVSHDGDGVMGAGYGQTSASAPDSGSDDDS